MHEFDEIDLFFYGLARHIEETTVLATYKAMSEESRRKYRESIVINTCKAQSPKKNYGISMATIREFVGKVLDGMETQSKGERTNGEKEEAQPAQEKGTAI